MAENKKQPTIQERVQQLLRDLKIGYINGQNPMGRAQVGHGYFPAKNASLNIGALMNMPYDPEMRIRPKDPQQQLRSITSGIGRVERIHNAYIKPRVKLAD
jgi:hypothetical protein